MNGERPIISLSIYVAWNLHKFIPGVQDFEELKYWTIQTIRKIKGFNEKELEKMVRTERESERLRNVEDCGIVKI